MLAAFAIAALLQLRAAAPAQGESVSRFAAEVASLRLRWHSGLDAAGWDIDAPAARQLADALSEEGLSLRGRNPGLHAASDAFALDQLLVRMGGAAMRSLVRESPMERARWIEAWLRWSSARPDDVRALIDASGMGAAALEMVARWRPAEAGPLLREAVSTGRWEAACGAVLLLPAAQRATYSPLVIEGANHAERHEDATVCASAMAIVPRTQSVAAQRLLQHLGPGSSARPSAQLAESGGSTAVGLGLAVALAGTSADAVSRRYLATMTLADRDGRGDVAAFRAARMVARMAPWLRPAPSLAGAARTLARAAGSASWHLLTSRVRWRDPALLGDCLEVLASPGARDPLVLWCARATGALTSRAGEARTRAITALQSFQQSTQGTHPTLRPEEVTRWIEALREAPCDDDVCAAEVFESGTDERAAREVLLRGGAGLASLAPQAARALVARVVQRGRAGREASAAEPGMSWSATAWAVFATVEGCPPSLRGLREAGLPPNDSDLLVTPWRDALERACRDEVEPSP